MRPVYWLEQNGSDVPADELWLAAGEKPRLHELRVPGRRKDWLLGRWTAKRAVAAFLNVGATPEILSAIDLAPGQDGAPVVRLLGEPAPVAISLSHRDGRALCVVGPAGHALGCDLERIEPHSEGFISDYFTKEEREFLRTVPDSTPQRYPAVLWSAKESILKLLHVGLRVDTRSVSVRLTEDVCSESWYAFQGVFVNGATFRGWWRTDSGFVSTAAAFPPTNPPVGLELQPVDTDSSDNLPCGKIQVQHACLA